MDEYPDSVLQLLNIQPEEIEDFSDKECARYALLLARATDKCKLSLLPCDSLLNVALEYYDDDEKEKAIALLYKGRLAVEMEEEKEAISYLQKGLIIIQNMVSIINPLAPLPLNDFINAVGRAPTKLVSAPNNPTM